jgi:ATP-binding cassette subfamily F protein 3
VAALSEFIGTLIFISHDVYFIRAIATKVLHINAGVLTPYAGDYDYYLEKTKASSARVALTSASTGKGLTNGRPETGKQQRVEQRNVPQASGKDRRQQTADARKALVSQRKHVAQLEAQVEALERKQGDLANELEKPTSYTTPGRALTLNQQLRAVAHDLHRTNVEWEAAATRLEQLEAEAKE